MEELHAIAGVLLISAIALTGYFVVTSGSSGAVSQEYLSCCCNILTGDGSQALVRSQVQMFADDCPQACERYTEFGTVFSQKGLCAENP